MKNLSLLFVFAVLSSTLLFAQDRVNDKVKDKEQDKIHLVLFDGDVFQIKDRDQLHLKDKITLNDGTLVETDGTYQKVGGDKLRLRDEECLDMDGNLYANEYQYQLKIKQQNKDLTVNQKKQANQNRYQVTLIDGQLYQIKAGEQIRLQQKLNLKNGTIVNPDGTYQKRDQKQLQLKEFECLNMDGEMYKNIYQQRKMGFQKNMMMNKNNKQIKPTVKKMVKAKKGY